VFSKIDLKGGFNQFKIEEQHQEYTTFTWRGKQYRFVGSPFGFKHLPAQFQQVMTKLFGDLPCVLVYIDDIVIFSDNYSDHQQHVQTVLQRLNQSNLRVNFDKCLFGLREILILGYVISADGIKVCKDKLLQIDA
jgi:hypothetical protein